MADAKHTPGPWSFRLVKVQREVFSVAHGFGGPVAYVHGQNVSEAESIANARLVAAAPELLEAADLVNVECRALSPTSAAHIGKLIRAIEVLNRARAKATRSAS